jgi:uroporphyrin-3 C-methyltransferase
MSNDDKPAASHEQAEQAAESTLPTQGQAEAAAEGGGTPPAAAAETPADEARGRRDGVGRLLAILAFLVALAAVAGSAFVFWQYRQFSVALAATDTLAQEALTRVRGDLRAVRDELEQMAADQRAAQRALADQRAEVAGLAPRFVELEERMAAAQGVSGDARRRWLRAEAEYLLSAANAELTLGGRFEAAAAALDMADDKLRELGNPGFTPVREAVADELQRLRAVSLPDVEGLSLTVGSLARRIDTMPLASPSPDVYEQARADPDDLEPGLQRAWASLKSALKGMISIERRDAPVARTLSAEEQRLIRRTLELELSAARLALLREQSEPYRQGLTSAKDALQRYFDTADVQVVSALALLEELLTMDIQPARPDISGSLTLLRQLSGQEAQPQ